MDPRKSLPWLSAQPLICAVRGVMRTSVAGFGLLLPISSGAQTETYQNPVDSETYVAPGGWKTYQPAPGVTPRQEEVSLDGVRLLQDQAEIASRTSVEELAAFIGLAHKAAVLLVQFTCAPQKCPANIAFQGEPPKELLQAYYERLTQLQPLRISGEVKFQFTRKVQP